jgi:imidazolonepropionase-like amidohydrolase
MESDWQQRPRSRALRELGQVKQGYLADLLMVDDDPLANVRILRDASRLVGIMKDGAFHKHPIAYSGSRRLAAQ